jgi:hypothetical protein
VSVRTSHNGSGQAEGRRIDKARPYPSAPAVSGADASTVADSLVTQNPGIGAVTGASAQHFVSPSCKGPTHLRSRGTPGMPRSPFVAHVL